MKVLFAEQAWQDYQYWLATDKQMLKRINLLIRDSCRNPFEGIGKPEPLRHLLKGYWSRRINSGHILQIAQLRFHYQ
jgi:toxin YoeB